MKLRNSYKYFYSILGQFLILSFVVFVFIFYKYNYSFELISESIETTLIAMAFTSPFFIIPLLILFLNYWYYNKNSTLEVRENVFFYKDKKRDVRFYIADIKQVTMHMNYVRLQKFPGIFFWNQYFYSKFELNDGTIFFITCLLNDEIEFIVPKNLVKIIARPFPLVQTNEVEIEVRKHKKRIKNIEKKQSNTFIKTQKFKDKFKDKTIEDLQNILNNKDQYQQEAVKATEILLKEKIGLN